MKHILTLLMLSSGNPNDSNVNYSAECQLPKEA